MTAEEQVNLEVARRYEDLYNTDTERFVRECYTPDCEINGGAVRGHEGLLETERRVFAAAPERRMRVERTHAAGSVVVVEAVLLDPEPGPDWKLPLCAVLTCRDGKIASDWTYAEFKKWPGLRPNPPTEARKGRGVSRRPPGAVRAPAATIDDKGPRNY
jgi:predicted SnoaL-like aldol condensation-catalyzing enzyme